MLKEPTQKPLPRRLGGMELLGQRVVVTGATGFLGGHVLRELRATGARVIAVVDRKRALSRHQELTDEIQTIWFDRADEIANAVVSAQPDFVIHLHAAVVTQRSGEAFRTTLETNLLPSLDMMAAFSGTSIKRLILMGTGEEFGPHTGPFDDNSIPDPPSPYGASKAAVTAYAKMFYTSFGLPVVVLRPSVVYGPGQAPRMLIPQVMHALRAGLEVAVTEGRQTRDFIHVKDVARGIIAALLAEGILGRSYNLASGEIVTVRECLKKIEEITGQANLIQFGALPYKVGEIFSYEPVSAKTFADLHWRPSIWLDDGLADTWHSLQ